jgi:hypothetical protein
VSLIGGCSGNLGVLLSLRCVLVALHVVVLAMMVCGGAMRLGCAFVVIGGFGMGLTGHCTLSLSREFRSLTYDLNSVRRESICCF